MENQKSPDTGVTQPTMAQQSKALDNRAATDKTFAFNLQCSIRRKPGLVGLPGTDPNDRIYKVGASFDQTTKKNLKGVEGKLEEMFMPSIIGLGYTDTTFQTQVDDYWGNLSVFIPADDTFLKNEEKGKVLKMSFEIKGEALKNKVEATADIEDKVFMLKAGIEKGTITISHKSISDFIFLCYCLRYSRVAKTVTLLEKSPKILFYIFNKNSAVQSKLSSIELRNKAIASFNAIKDNEHKVNQVLMMFNHLPDSFDSLNDKIIVLDEEYNKSTDNMKRFVDYEQDSNLSVKYLITYAVKKGKLNNPSNTEAYYYNQVLIGRTLDEAVLFLTDTGNTDARLIKDTLERELK